MGKNNIAVMEPEVEKAVFVDKTAEDRAELIATIQRIEQWARFNDGHVRKMCIDSLRKVGAWE